VKRLIVYGKAEEEFTESIVENEFIWRNFTTQSATR
jgi:hypothetical protein